MRRSYLLKKLSRLTDHALANKPFTDLPEIALDIVERYGMLPPSVPAKNIKGENYSWGYGCTMRCNCECCNPNYPINVWEDESSN